MNENKPNLMRDSMNPKCRWTVILPLFLVIFPITIHPYKSTQMGIIAVIKKAERHIKKIGIEKAIIEFKNSKNIVIGDYSGMFFVSPLHPELIGKNQFDYKDSTGALVVQEEINKAKAGGGWLKGRWRMNSMTGKYQCRKIYILPIAGNYYIGSWYHYSSDMPGVCLL